MKKILFLFLAAGLFSFASCDSPRENAAEERADRLEDAAERSDVDEMEEIGDDIEDSVDAAH